jgi:choice-of-anchor C domain-containing protein
MAALAASFSVCSAQANLLNNGSFELGAPSSGCVSATTSLTGWSVVAGNIDIDSARTGCSGGFGINAADGEFFIDLTGSYAAGKISQTVATQAGQNYTLGFWFGGNPVWQYIGSPNDGAIKSMNVLVDGATLANFSVDTTGRAGSDASWIHAALNFTADSNSTAIEFDSLDTSGVFGPFLDGVSLDVSPVPEPETYALMLAGLAVVGAAAKRRRKNT